MSVNKAILIGNLGRDPEVKQTASGTSIANLRIATTERRKSGDSWEDHTEWHSVTCFGKTAENVGKFLAKGRQVYVEGRIQTRKWQDKDGQDRWSTEIVGDVIRFLGGGGQSEGGRSTQQDRQPQKQSGGYGRPDDDIPF